MVRYDAVPPVLYDSGARYDESDPPQVERKRMAKVKLNLRDKTDDSLVPYTDAHITAMTGNANFTTPDPSAADFLIKFNAYKAALAQFKTAQQAAKEKTASKDAARLDLETVLTDRGSYVERKSGGDKAKILSSGFDVKGDPTPSAAPGRVQNLVLTAGDADGELDASWDREKGARTYEVQISVDPFTPTSWQGRSSVTKSRTTLDGLTSGAKMWVRVRALGAGGTGDWCDPAIKVVP